jgi:SAM-dependent methyltransferase
MNKGKLFTATLMPDEDWWHALWPNPSQVIQDAGITADMDVVDLCCGDGYFTKHMCELVDPNQVYAVDMDTDLLALADKACASYSNYQSIAGDALDLPQLVTKPVDFVFMANTFHGVPDPLYLSQAVNQTLNDSGRFAIINWYRKPREETTVLDLPRGPDTELRMQPEEVQAIVEPAGFVLESVVDVGPYHYGAIFSKTDNK